MLSIDNELPLGVATEQDEDKSGFASGMLESVESPVAWNRYRVVAAAAIGLVSIVLAVLWGWSGGFLVLGLAMVAVAEAYWRDRRGRVAILPSAFLDVTLVVVGATLADLGSAGVVVPLIYVVAVPLLMLPSRACVILLAYAAGGAFLALTTASPLPPPSEAVVRSATAASFVTFAILLVGIIAMVGKSLRTARQAMSDRLDAEAALRIAGGELLSNVEESALVHALEGVKEVTGADVAFVAENSGDRHTGPAAVVRQVSTAEEHSAGWTLPYMQHRAAAAELANGRAVRLDDALGIAMGRAPGTTAALAVPISVRGEWAGFLGVAYTNLPAPKPEVEILETIGAMIGSYLERQQAYAKLEKAVHSKDQFLASVSHEIRTPLTSILGFASLLREDEGSLSKAEVSDLARLIQLQSQDVADLVEDLLVAARTEIDAVRINLEPVDLSVEVDRVLSARIDVDGKDVHVVTSPRHVVVADPTRVRQILRNLLTNAIRYGGDEITITTHRDGPEIALVFSDNGEGVPPEQRRLVFDAYHRGKDAMTRPESIGLGLAVSRQLARLMDGDLTLRSDLGPATFQLSLPITPEPKEEEPPQETVLASESTSAES